MAITITDTPINYHPVGVPTIWTVQSDNVSQDSFRYFCRVLKLPNSEFLGELKSTPHPIHGWGKFDPSTIFSTELDYTFDIENGNFTAMNGLQRFKVEFGEEYIDATGSFVRTENDANWNTWVFNGTPFYNEYLHLREDNDRYISTNFDSDNWPLTSRRTVETVRGTKQWLYFMTDTYTQAIKLKITDEETNEVDYIVLDPSLQTSEKGLLTGWRVDADYIESNTLLTDLNEWSINIQSDIDTDTSNKIVYKHLDCNRWDLYSLYYLNRWGGIDSFSFNGKSTTQVQTQRESYKTTINPISSTGEVSYDPTLHSVKDYSVNTTDVITLRSGWVSHSQQVSAIDLQSSPRVWMEDKDGLVIPVRIDSEEMEIKNRNDGVIHVTVTVRYEQPIKRIRG